MNPAKPNAKFTPNVQQKTNNKMVESAALSSITKMESVMLNERNSGVKYKSVIPANSNTTQTKTTPKRLPRKLGEVQVAKNEPPKESKQSDGGGAPKPEQINNEDRLKWMTQFECMDEIDSNTDKLLNFYVYLHVADVIDYTIVKNKNNTEMIAHAQKLWKTLKKPAKTKNIIFIFVIDEHFVGAIVKPNRPNTAITLDSMFWKIAN